MKQISDKAFKQYQSMCHAAGIEPEKWTYKEVKPGKWTPSKQNFFFNQRGDVAPATEHTMPEIGRERSTKALCKIASDRTMRANIISAWLDSEGSGEQDISSGKKLCCIYSHKGKYYIYELLSYDYPDIVYMLIEDGIKLCKALNDGVVVL